jgi:hypothetical protein
MTLPLISSDPVEATKSAVRYLLSLRPENESVADFLMRHVDYERKRYPPAPPTTAEPIAVPTKRARKPTVADHETRHWPPLHGQTYRGPWPPKGLVTPQPRCAKGPTFDLDEGQKAWLERYSEKYPDACNPWQLLTPREADARDARMLLSAEFAS